MGAVEEKARRTNLQKIMLGMIAVVDALDEVAASGRMLVVMRRMGLAPKRRQLEFVERTRKRLKEKGLIKTVGGKLRLTPEGERRLRMLQLNDYQLPKPRKWDGKWRILIFDIPQYRKSMRDKLRRTLSKIGFVRLQRSVWLYPYDCEDFVVLLKADFHIGNDLLYLVVDALENDTPYKKYFGLPIKEALRGGLPM